MQLLLVEALPAPPHFPKAACREIGVDLAWFFPTRGEHAGPAQATCARCPHQIECGEWAVAVGPSLRGVWGGLCEADRTRIRRQRRSGLSGLEPVTPLDQLDAARTNGHGPEPVVASEPVAVVDGAPASCVECGGPVPASKPGRPPRRVCSNGCAARIGHRSQQIAATTDQPRPARRSRTGRAPRPPARAGSVLGALMEAGVHLDLIELTLGGERWRLERMTANGKDLR